MEDTLGDLLQDAELELRAGDCHTLADAVKQAREMLSDEVVSGVYHVRDTLPAPPAEVGV